MTFIHVLIVVLIISNFREAFAKLAGVGSDKNVSVQELFPWTLKHSKNKQYEALQQQQPSDKF